MLEGRFTQRRTLAADYRRSISRIGVRLDEVETFVAEADNESGSRSPGDQTTLATVPPLLLHNHVRYSSDLYTGVSSLVTDMNPPHPDTFGRTPANTAMSSNNAASARACLACRSIKVKCMIQYGEAVCRRCSRKSLDCVFRPHQRGRKVGTRCVTPRQHIRYILFQHPGVHSLTSKAYKKSLRHRKQAQSVSRASKKYSKTSAGRQELCSLRVSCTMQYLTADSRYAMCSAHQARQHRSAPASHQPTQPVIPS